MRVNVTASMLATLALLSGAGRSTAQQPRSTLLTAMITDTAGASAQDARTDAATDTSTTDALGRGNATRENRHGITSPDFFEIRLLTSRHSTVPSRMPIPMYRDMYIVDFRAGWTLTSNRFLSVEYAPSIVPLAISTRNPQAYVPHAMRTCVQGKSCEDFTALDVQTVPLFSNTYGFGLTPVGFQLRLFRTKPVQLLTYANGGALWFTHRIPDPEATRFNFTAELGTAIQIDIPDRLGLVVGYSWHHTSNGGTGHVNPGLNSRALSIGIVARRDR